MVYLFSYWEVVPLLHNALGYLWPLDWLLLPGGSAPISTEMPTVHKSEADVFSVHSE